MKRVLVVLAALTFLANVSSVQAAVPIQTITVVNNANVNPKNLAKVERAVSLQSVQLHMYWNTPAVVFGPGGWILTMTDTNVVHNSDGSTTMTTGGRHCGPLGNPKVGSCFSDQPTLFVDTGTLSYKIWARAFSHEIGEALIDSNDSTAYTGKYGNQLLEIADPVENITYSVAGVNLSDLTTPADYFGSVLPNSIVTPNHGPYDLAERLSSQS